MPDVGFKNTDVAFKGSDVGFGRRSFKDVINNIVYLLQNDVALQNFSKTRWQTTKSLTVSKAFKKRIFINLRDLPLILITMPFIEKSFLINTNRNSTHTIRLYCGFIQNNPKRALEDFIEFEELIDDALLFYEPEQLGALNLIPKSSENDEGLYHPVYFLTLDVEVKFRR